MRSKGALHRRRGMNHKSRWEGATFGGDEAEAEERGRKTHLRGAWIHGGASLWRDEVGWQEAIDGLAWLGKSARGVFADVLGAQREEDREESAQWQGQFAW